MNVLQLTIHNYGWDVSSLNAEVLDYRPSTVVRQGGGGHPNREQSGLLQRRGTEWAAAVAEGDGRGEGNLVSTSRSLTTGPALLWWEGEGELPAEHHGGRGGHGAARGEGTVCRGRRGEEGGFTSL